MRTHAVVIAYGESPAHWTGTGTRIGPRQVLTAAHVLKGPPADLRVKLNGSQSLPATIAWQHPKLDVAVLTTTEDFPTGDRPRWLEQVSTGQAWEASGYPRLTQKDQPPATDLHQVTGTTCSCAPGETTLNLVCHTAARLPTAAATAEVPGAPALVYGGLSGAGVWVNGCLAGVVGQLLPELQGSQVQAIPYGAFASADFRRAAGLGVVPPEVVARLVDLASQSPALCKAVAQELTLADQSAPAVVAALLIRPAQEAAGVLNRADRRLSASADRQIQRRLVGALIPYLAERVWSALSDGRVHTLGVATETLAELIVARLDDRDARLVLVDESAYPVGATALIARQFAAQHLPVADEAGRELAGTMLKHQYARFSTDLDLNELGLDELRRRYRLRSDASLSEIEDNAAYNLTDPDEPRYYLLFDTTCSAWWAVRGARFCEAMPPSIQIVRLDLPAPSQDEVFTARHLAAPLKRPLES